MSRYPSGVDRQYFAQFDDFGKRIARLESIMATKAASYLQSDVATLQSDVAAIQGDITTIEGDVAEVSMVHNVKAYGAVGNGVANDTTAIQAAITAAYATGGRGIVFFPSGTYLIGSSYINLTDSIDLVGASDAIITKTPTTTPAIYLAPTSGARVRIKNLAFVGASATAYASLDDGIKVTADVTCQVEITGCSFSGFGHAGVLAQSVDGLKVDGCYFTDLPHGVYLDYDVAHATVTNNSFYMLDTRTGNLVSYCIYLGNTTANLGATETVISNNKVDQCAGSYFVYGLAPVGTTIAGNVVRSVLEGVVFDPQVNGSNVSSYAPRRISITGNSLVGIANTSSAYGGSGVRIYGAGSVAGTVVQQASASITGNTFRHFGGNAHSYAVTFERTSGLVVSGNVFADCHEIGVYVWGTCNRGYSVTGNTFTDVISMTGNTHGVFVDCTYSSGVVTDNMFTSNDTSATYANNYRVRYNYDSSSKAFMRLNTSDSFTDAWGTYTTTVSSGVLTLNGTTEVTINTSLVSSSTTTKILTGVIGPGPAGMIYMSTMYAGTSFGFKSTNAADTSTKLAWQIIED